MYMQPLPCGRQDITFLFLRPTISPRHLLRPPCLAQMLNACIWTCFQSDSPYLLSFYSENEDDTVVYCQSAEGAVNVHPADAIWLCE